MVLGRERLELDRLAPLVVFFAAGLRVAVLLFVLLEPLFAAEDFGFDEDERDFVERDRPELDREAPLRELDEPELADDDASIDHLPLITRCAASATASAISDPSFVALAIIDFAAFSVVSAASIPASRIALRAVGLAAIAAAAAVRPAASISLLIAALASFSVVDFVELDDFEPVLELFEDVDPLLLLDFAIANLLLGAAIDPRLQ